MVKSNPRLPDLDNPKRFVKIDRVPIIDTCERTYYTKDQETGEFKEVNESIDSDQLRRFRDNSHAREERGELGLIFIGHTTDGGKEIDQPPTTGFMKNYQMGEHEGNEALLVDLYIDKKDDPSEVLRQYPRRSSEIVDIHSKSGYVDSIALLKRVPERPLGMIARYSSKSRNISRFECPSCERKREEKEMDNEAAMRSMLERLIPEVLEKLVGGDVATAIADAPKSSRFAKNPSEKPKMGMNDDPDEDPSDEEPSDEDPSIEEPSEHVAKKPARMKRMDPSEDEPSEPSEPSPSEPSKMKSHKPKSRYSRSDFNRLQREVARMRRERRSPDPSADRMRRDQVSTKVSRYEARISSLEKDLQESKAKARRNELEAMVIQLESEGISLDRARTVSKFQKMTSDEITEEIEDIRRFNTRSPVGQPFIGGFLETGGKSVERPLSYADALKPRAEDMNSDGSHIIGSGLARFAKLNKIEPTQGNSLETANEVVSRYIASREKPHQ